MRQVFRYGAGEVALELPAANCAGVIEPRLPPAVEDVESAVFRALDEPIGTPPLSEVLKGCGRVAVAIPDATRGEAVAAYLPPLLRYIERCGIGPERVVIVTATGAHRRHTDAERAALVGPKVAGRWRVEDHDADSGNVEIGPLDAETPLLVDERAVGADCLILAGRLSHHYCAGFGGGRKLVAPGLCARATTVALHRRTLENIASSGEWRSRSGELDGNPFHEALSAAAARVGPRFALHVAAAGKTDVIDVVAGDVVRSHEVACGRYDRIFRVPAPSGRLPLAIASCGGRPYDVNLYQAHKALDNAFRAVEPGGTIVLLAECAEGWGPRSFAEWLAVGSLEEHRERLAAGFEIVGHTTYALKWKAAKCRIIIASEGLARRVARGEGPPWLGGKGRGRTPFALEIVGDPAEALKRSGVFEGKPYYAMPLAAQSLPAPLGQS